MRVYEKTEKRKTSSSKRYNQLKMNAKSGGREMSLTLDEFLSVANQPCHYCNDELCQDRTGTRLDRRDNSKGYTLDNVVACCKYCNSVKQELFTEEETLVMVKALVEWRRQKHST